jgi:hypothetical protein
MSHKDYRYHNTTHRKEILAKNSPYKTLSWLKLTTPKTLESKHLVVREQDEETCS